MRVLEYCLIGELIACDKVPAAFLTGRFRLWRESMIRPGRVFSFLFFNLGARRSGDGQVDS